jgi:DNA-binding response OmpR family regulator
LKTTPRVLIIDRSAESREVLRLLLERRGATALEASRLEEAMQLADRFRPDLIVLDAESDHSAAGQATDELRQAAHRTATPLVILGRIRPSRGLAAGGEIIAKPYHYGSLIRRINDLLAAA